MNIPVLNLTDGDAPFSSDPARSFTMPARFYFDAEIYEMEKPAIFYKSWIYAGHVSQLAEQGSYISPPGSMNRTSSSAVAAPAI